MNNMNHHDELHNNKKNDDDGEWSNVPPKKKKKPKKRNNWSTSPPPPPPAAAIMSSSDGEQFILMLVGLPGSGKSTFAQSLEQVMPQKFARINQDKLKTRKKCISKTEHVLKKGLCPIIDRCNFDPAQRHTWIELAHSYGVPIDCIVLEVSLPECIRRCQSRTNHETIKPEQAATVVPSVFRQWVPPGRRQQRGKDDNELSMIRSLIRIRNSKEWHETIQNYLGVPNEEEDSNMETKELQKAMEQIEM